MEIRLRLILTTYFFVNSGWTLVRSHDSISDQEVLSNVDNAGKMQGNIQNLFNSIVKDDMKMSEAYQLIVKPEIAKGQRTFNEMKEELRIAQYKNADKMRNFYEGSKAGKDRVLIKREPNPLQLKEEKDDSAPPSGPLQFSDAVCKKICVTAIGDLLDAFYDFQDKFIDELRLANESMAYDISEKIGELSRKVFQRKLLLNRIKDKTPCDCADEFIKVEDYEDKIDEAYDFLLIRFDKIDKEETSTPRHYNDYMGFWKGRVMHPSTHDPMAENIV